MAGIARPWSLVDSQDVEFRRLDGKATMTDTSDRAWQGPSATAGDVSATPMDAGEETGIGALGLAAGPLVWRSHWRTGAWGLMALMLGAAFWHVVGFWSFLTSASFHGDQTKTHVAGHVSGYVADSPFGTTPLVRDLSTAETSRNCTTLTRDLGSGRTMSRSCVVVMGNALIEASAPPQRRFIATSARLDRIAYGR